MSVKIPGASMGRVALFCTVMGLGVVLTASASYAQLVSAKAGQELAEKLCTSCHIVGKEPANASMPSDVPSFTEIANRPDQTAVRIAGRIVIPHPAMPQIQLSRQEIADLAAYILSLRKP